MNYDILINKIVNNKEYSDILHMIIRVYSIYFQKKALNSLFEKKNTVNNLNGFGNMEDFITLKNLLREKFKNESWDQISDCDIFNNIILKINMTKKFRA